VGDKVILTKGKYLESIRMTRPIQILGEGHVSDIIIETSGRDTVVFETEFGVLRGVTLRQRGTKDGRRRLRIHNCGGTGVYVYDSAKGAVEDCDIFENAQSGVEIAEGGDPEIKFNRIRENAQHGVLVHDNGKGHLTDNDIFKNRLAGVEVRESGNPKVHRNKIYGHETSGGVYVHHYGRGELEKNDVYNNSLSGIVVWQSGKPVCRQNRVSMNGEFGIHVRDGGWGTYEDNDLRANARGGILVNPDCKLKVIEDRNLID
ncbi:pectin lyase fold/virulence factor, partial [Baffinella frigidus]